VVVTGTASSPRSGAGKADNCGGSTAGDPASGRSRGSATDEPQDQVAGTVDFIPLDPYSAPDLSERLAELAVEEAIAESRLGSRGHFPGRCFSRWRRSNRMAHARRWPGLGRQRSGEL